jgi:hypothetical protein
MQITPVLQRGVPRYLLYPILRGVQGDASDGDTPAPQVMKAIWLAIATDELGEMPRSPRKRFSWPRIPNREGGSSRSGCGKVRRIPANPAEKQYSASLSMLLDHLFLQVTLFLQLTHRIMICPPRCRPLNSASTGTNRCFCHRGPIATCLHRSRPVFTRTSRSRLSRASCLRSSARPGMKGLNGAECRSAFAIRSWYRPASIVWNMENKSGARLS